MANNPVGGVSAAGHGRGGPCELCRGLPEGGGRPRGRAPASGLEAASPRGARLPCQVSSWSFPEEEWGDQAWVFSRRVTAHPHGPVPPGVAQAPGLLFRTSWLDAAGSWLRRGLLRLLLLPVRLRDGQTSGPAGERRGTRRLLEPRLGRKGQRPGLVPWVSESLT